MQKRNMLKEHLFFGYMGQSVEAVNQAMPISKKIGETSCPNELGDRIGFAWEDWGRMDAYGKVYWQISKKLFKPDNNKIYLTGHSMGWAMAHGI